MTCGSSHAPTLRQVAESEEACIAADASLTFTWSSILPDSDFTFLVSQEAHDALHTS